MDIDIHTQDETIRKIEDIIDIQKANGNINVRQVAFKLPETDSSVSANVAKSLESGLTTAKSEKGKKKKYRTKRNRSPLPDVISWPSDSDITVLRMKLCMTSSDLKDKVGNVILGDGLHQPDSSSMVNLATLLMQSQPPSKQSINVEELLLPLSSWEEARDCDKNETLVEELPEKCMSQSKCSFQVYGAACRHAKRSKETLNFSDSAVVPCNSAKSKFARFLRLYFCPCCTCLYKIENMSDEHSVYSKKRKEARTL